MTEQDATRELPQPLRAAASVLGRVPGAGLVGRAAGGALDKVGAVSPRGRRLAVYTGAGVLGVAGVVEWPVAVTGAAVAWLTQPRPQRRPDGAAAATGAGTGAATGTGAGTATGTGAGTAVNAGTGAGETGRRGGGDVSGAPAAPRVRAGHSAGAAAAERTTAPATPSAKLPPHHATPSRAARDAEGE
ncbi:hypothetical protein ACF09K_05500 [Streptomyces sp. NPDC014882]|uniref:hypothetical protein n=1 Tax=Streptomyces sp. NPDC014882 TaxID=3364927 RepID=UPI0037025E4E